MSKADSKKTKTRRMRRVLKDAKKNINDATGSRLAKHGWRSGIDRRCMGKDTDVS